MSMTNKSKINQYYIHSIQKRIDNRVCCDCNEILTTQNAFVSMQFAIWLCGNCADIHNRVLFSETCSIKSIHEDWSDFEYQRIKKSSNLKVNLKYEKFVPPESIFRRISSESNSIDRERWIKAKYFFKIFMIPQSNLMFDVSHNNKLGFLQTSKKQSSQKAKSELTTMMTTRLLDFYIVVGYSKLRKYDYSTITHNFVPENAYFNPIILSVYPNKNAYSDFEFPEMVSHLVFPNGLHLSSVEKEPTLFSLVLHDINRIKMFCVVLIYHEILDPQSIDSIAFQINSNEGCYGEIKVSSVVYAPKAVVILSHYPFYHLFSIILKQLYRISLSSLPLPFERYFVNIWHEIPLPPSGRIEVSANIADVIVQIRRSQPNQLPMIDFSYRPLFMSLSVDNILTIFRGLLNECSVCFFSSYLSLLTPIQEALLSLLYPLSWQHVYIPILEESVVDIIEAPVPIIVGMKSVLFNTICKFNLPRNMLLVDIDNDTIMTNSIDVSQNCNASALDHFFPLPKQPVMKLKSKLMEFGGIVHNKLANSKITCNCDAAFQFNEQLIPIPTENFTVSGLVKRKNSISSVNQQNTKANHPILSTYVTYKTDSYFHSTAGLSLFDPKNNYDPVTDKFDAREIRGAFLRFFVYCFQDYHQLMSKQNISKYITLTTDGLSVKSDVSSNKELNDEERFSSSM